MGLNVPFSCNALPFPFPRRLAYIVGCLVTVILLLNLLAPSTLPPAISRYPGHASDESYLSGSKWIPPLLNPHYKKPDEWDENGLCLFLSPFDALSPAEKAAAEQMTLVEVSPGIVKVENAVGPTGKPLNPILALLREGEKKWNGLISSQSKTLEQAVKKYESRWGRPPPKGFDDWWMFAQDRDTLLIDEFDGIMDSLLPFYGLPIPTLKERLKEVETLTETFTIIVYDGKVELQWNDPYSRDTWRSSRGRADSQINLMESFINLIPGFRATYTVHDQPSILMDHARRKQLVDAARSHKVSNDPEPADRIEQDWHKACPPDSPLNKGVKEGPASDTFIANHIASMDICSHPSLLDIHGMLLEKHDKTTWPKPHTKLYPLFAPSKATLNGDIPITPVGNDGRNEEVGHDYPWNEKKGELYWRGRTTGMSHNKHNGAKWRQSHRERLHRLANNASSTVTQEVLIPTGSNGETDLRTYDLQYLSDHYLNIKLVSGPLQCDEKDGTCDDVREEIGFGPEESPSEPNKYKYVLDVDGNAWSARFTRLMASLNVVIKASIFPEWSSGNLPEWFAYVPAKLDYSDLYSIMAFFRGSPSGKGSHDEVARRIALNSQCWVERTWRRADLEVYMFRLYLEYMRLVSPDRDNGKMDFVLQEYHRDPPEANKNVVDSLKEAEAIPGIDQ